jgi:hypothetical protein
LESNFITSAQLADHKFFEKGRSKFLHRGATGIRRSLANPSATSQVQQALYAHSTRKADSAPP